MQTCWQKNCLALLLSIICLPALNLRAASWEGSDNFAAGISPTLWTLNQRGQWCGTQPMAPAHLSPDPGAWTRGPRDDVDRARLRKRPDRETRPGVPWRIPATAPGGGVRPEVVAGSAIFERFLPASNARSTKTTPTCNIQKSETCLPLMRGKNHRQ